MRSRRPAGAHPRPPIRRNITWPVRDRSAAHVPLLASAGSTRPPPPPPPLLLLLLLLPPLPPPPTAGSRTRCQMRERRLARPCARPACPSCAASRREASTMNPTAPNVRATSAARTGAQPPRCRAAPRPRAVGKTGTRRCRATADLFRGICCNQDGRATDNAANTTGRHDEHLINDWIDSQLRVHLCLAQSLVLVSATLASLYQTTTRTHRSP